MSFATGLAGQSARNATFEPWRGNTRSSDPMTRAGETVANTLFVAVGSSSAALAAPAVLRGGSPAARIGAALVAGLGVTAAALGLTNLFGPGSPSTLPALHPSTPRPSASPEPRPTPKPSEQPRKGLDNAQPPTEFTPPPHGEPDPTRQR